jgi:DNA-binding NarL/FixJ family response regulator
MARHAYVNFTAAAPEFVARIMRRMPTEMPTRVLVVDDNPVVRAVLRDMLDDGRTVTIVAEAANGDEALRLAATHRPDVTLLDHRMPLRDGLSVVAALGAYTRVVMLTRSGEDESILAAVRSGAAGYLIHGQFTPAELLAAIRDVTFGEAHLSPSAARVVLGALRDPGASAGPVDFGLSAREREITGLIADGHSNRAIADRLFLSPKTVENHVNHIYAKLNATTRAEATATWRRHIA